MGLFDILKKVLQSSTNEKQEKPISIKTDETPVSSVEKKEIISKVPSVAFEQDGPPSLNSLIEKAIPSKQGLYPHEIMMLEYAPHFKITNNSFQNFWYWQYSVTEPQAILDSLFERGFIEIGDLRTALEKLKLTEIKEELKALNQKVSGN